MFPLRKLLSINSHDRWVLTEAVVLLAITELLLRTQKIPLRRISTLLDRIANQMPARGRTPPPDRIRWAVNGSANYLPGEIACLPRALVSQCLLQRWGYTTTIHIGVSHNDQDGVDAHAWVKYDDKVIIGDLPDLERYSPLPISEF